MPKLTKTNLFNTPEPPRKETPMDKTTRVVKDILNKETEQRQVRTSLLRKARLEQEASALEQAAKATPKVARKKPRAKAVK